MIYVSNKSKLDQYLPAMLLALEIKNNYRGQMIPQEMALHIQDCLWGTADKTNEEVSSQAQADSGWSPSVPIEKDDALFAACAFIDEALMNSQWSGRDQWPGHSLVRFYFDTAQAGIVFFDRLNQLLREQGGVRSSGELDLDIIRSYEYSTSYPKDSNVPRQKTGLKTQLKIFLKTQVKQLWENLRIVVTTLNGTFEQETQDVTFNQVYRPINPWKETIEVYATALSLGFSGHFYGQGGRKPLELIKRETALALGPPLADAAGQWPGMVASVQHKPAVRYGEIFMTSLQFGIPLLVVFFFILLHKSMLVKFTVDWAQALGVGQ